MDVDFVVQGFDRTVGLSRYSRSLLPELRQQCDVTVRQPRLPWLLRRPSALIGDAETFFSTFPLAYEHSQSDLLHVSTQTMAVPLVYRDYGPTVVTVHDIFPYMFDHDGPFDPIEPWYERAGYRFAVRGLRKADHIIAISDATKRTLQEYLEISGERVTTVYYGVDHDTFRPRSIPDDAYDRFGLCPTDTHLLYVGSERPRKAVPELIEAFAAVVEEVPHATLVKVGGPEVPEQRQQVEATIQRLGVEEDIVFTGHVEDGLPLLYNLADAYVSAAYYEGFGLPFVEAMACGTPVVGRDQSAMPEVIGDGGVLFDSETELVEQLIELLTSEPRRSELSKRAHKRSELFSWEVAARDTAMVYDRLRNRESTQSGNRASKG